MAIIKSRLTPFGILAEYHKIESVEINAQNQTVNIGVSVYPDASSRAQAKKPLTTETVSIPFWRLATDPRSTFYKLLETFDRDNPLYAGIGDVDPGAVPQFEVIPYMEPPMTGIDTPAP